MGDFSYTVDFKVRSESFPGSLGPTYLLSGTFTNCQAGGGSVIEFGDDLGATEIVRFAADNLTDNDELIQISISGAQVTMVAGTNDDDGSWECVLRMGGGMIA